MTRARIAILLGLVLLPLALGSRTIGATSPVTTTGKVSQSVAAVNDAVTWTETITSNIGPVDNVIGRFSGLYHFMQSCRPAEYCVVNNSFGTVVFTIPHVESSIKLEVDWIVSGESRDPLYNGRWQTLAGFSSGVNGEYCSLDPCKGLVRLVGPLNKITLKITPAGPYLPGDVLHVEAVNTADAGPIAGYLDVTLPDGLGRPSNVSSGASIYDQTPLRVVAGRGIHDPWNGSISLSFDTEIVAPIGTDLLFEASANASELWNGSASTSKKLHVGAITTPKPATPKPASSAAATVPPEVHSDAPPPSVAPTPDVTTTPPSPEGTEPAGSPAAATEATVSATPGATAAPTDAPADAPAASFATTIPVLLLVVAAIAVVAVGFQLRRGGGRPRRP